MRIAQLSDLHLTPPGQSLYGRVDTVAAFLQALQRAVNLTPQLLLLTGDLASSGLAGEYDLLHRELSACGLPYALLPGNHDERSALQATFPEQAWSGAPLACQRLDVDGGTLLMLDTTVPGEEWGEVGAAQLAWLNAHCPDRRPVLLALHHPPFEVGIAGMDAIRCRGDAALATWLASRSNVQALLCGHVHRFVVSSFTGRPALIAPSPAHQIALADGPLAYTLEPGGFLLHDWTPGGALVSHYVPGLTAPIHVYENA